MLFEQLYQNFLELSEEERKLWFRKYVENRQQELSMTQIKVKRKRSSGKGKGKKKKERVIAVSPEQLEVLRKVGLI